MNVTFNSVALIAPATFKSPSIDAEVLTINPRFGEIDAVTLPLASLLASSANSDAGKLFNCEPSPWNEPLNEPDA